MLPLNIKQVTGRTQLEVVEGDDDKVIRIASNFPPAMFCTSRLTGRCEILMPTQVLVTDEDIQCLVTNEVLPQVVLDWEDPVTQGRKVTLASGCGAVLTNSNWELVHSVGVKAVRDGVADGDQERSMVVTAELTETITVNVGTVQVNTRRFISHIVF